MRQDLRYAWRALGRDRGFAATAILTLALGIAANTAIFSVINSVLLRPLPYKEPERLVVIREILGPLKHLYPVLPANAGHMLEWRKQCSSCEQIAAIRSIQFNLTGAGEPELVGGARVSANLFTLLGIVPQQGRVFVEEEDRRGNDRVAILTDSLWKRRFSSDASLVGRTISLDGHPYVVVGILPPDFRFPRHEQLGALSTLAARTDVFKPLGLEPWEISSPGDYNYAVIARLKPGATPERAQAEIDTAQTSIGARFQYDLRASLVPLQEQMVGNTRRGLVVLLAAVGAVLLIICLNLANLLLARSASRSREAAIRAALGASRARLVRQLMTESLLIAAAGGFLGLLLAYGGLDLLVRSAPIDLPRLEEIRPDARVLGFCLSLAVLTAGLFGFLPAWRLARAEPVEALKAGSHTTTAGARSADLRSTLIGVEVGCGAVLLVTAGLLMSSFARLVNVNKGFPPERLLAVDLLAPATKYPDAEKRIAFFDRVVAGAAALPGVRSAGVASALPLEGETWVDLITLEGDQRPPPERPLANYRFVSAGYFKTIGVPLRAGRLLEESDRKTRAVIVSEVTARRLWPGQNPIGKRFGRGDPKEPPYEIAGVVGDVRVHLQRDPPMMVYVGPWIRSRAKMTLVLRTTADPRAVIGALRAEIRSLDPEVPLANIRTMEEVVSGSVAQRRFQMSLVILFAASALVLACLGIYGVVSYSVARRRAEMGIRMALGAQASDLHRMVVLQGMAPVAAGLAAGIAVALGLGRVLRSLLFEVSPWDPLTYAAVAALLLAVGALACYIPAARATRLDPSRVLRYE